jgi:hypothetical protein
MREFMDRAFAPSPRPAEPCPGRRERSFELGLVVLVRGRDPASGEFAAPAEVASLSADEAVVWIDAPIAAGAKVLLNLRIPRTDLLERPLEMAITGTVRFVKDGIANRKPERMVGVKLDPRFRIQPSAA